MESGFFKIWRDLFEKPIWLNSTPEQKVILITLIKLANWKDKKWEWQGKPYHCRPGEFITSYNSIINACGKGVTYQNVRTAIKRFKNYEFLTYQVTVGECGGIKVILNNWDKYQREINTSANSSLTVSQQIANSSLTPNKEYKKEKNNNFSLSNSSMRIGKREREILKSYCKKNNVQNANAYIRKLIDSGDAAIILEEEKIRLEKLEKRKQESVQEIGKPENSEETEKAFQEAKKVVQMIFKKRGSNGNTKRDSISGIKEATANKY